MNMKQILYIVLAAAGILFPWYFIAQFFGAAGSADWSAFMAAIAENDAMRSMTADFGIVLIAFIAWMVPEARRLGMRNWWLYILLMGLVAASFAVPVFLFMRERKLAAGGSAAQL